MMHWRRGTPLILGACLKNLEIFFNPDAYLADLSSPVKPDVTDLISHLDLLSEVLFQMTVLIHDINDWQAKTIKQHTNTSLTVVLLFLVTVIGAPHLC